MNMNEQIYESIKSDVLDLLVDMLRKLDYDVFINRLEGLFDEHFNVSKIDLFLYQDNEFHRASSCRGADKSPIDRVVEISAPYAYTGILMNVDDPYEFADDTLMIRNSNREPIAIVLVKTTEQWDTFAVSEYVKEFQLLLGKVIETLKDSRALKLQSKNYHHLLEAIKQFNSTLETPVIYEQLVKTVLSDFSSLSVSVELILSQEEPDPSGPYRLFDYSKELSSTADAFLTGELTIGSDAINNKKILNAPVKGKQGTYGILQITAPSDYVFSTTQKDFVRSISESAGYAVENSSLYTQSYRLIRDLQLVNEVSKKLTGRLRREEMVGYINEKLIKTFEHEEIAFVSIRDGKRVLAKETSRYFYTPNGNRYLDFAENCIKKEQDAIYIPDLNGRKIDGFAPYRSLIITPMLVEDDFVGYSLLVHTEKYKFSFDDFKLAKAIVSHSSLALSNLALREKLQELADKDQLTGLFARGYLDSHMSDSFHNGEGGAFFLLDIDDFKQVNDRYGHAVGDLVLKQTARILQTNITDKDIAGRWGGEEFAVYLPGATLEEGKHLANQLLRELPQHTDPSITVSMGVSVWAPSTAQETYQQLFQTTDEALYSAKSGGKNRIVVSESVLAE